MDATVYPCIALVIGAGGILAGLVGLIHPWASHAPYWCYALGSVAGAFFVGAGTRRLVFAARTVTGDGRGSFTFVSRRSSTVVERDEIIAITRRFGFLDRFGTTCWAVHTKTGHVLLAPAFEHETELFFELRAWNPGMDGPTWLKTQLINV
jgi:hypothetical protein